MTFIVWKKRKEKKYTIGVNGDQKPSGYEHSSNIFFYVEVNKEIHTGSEQLEAE